MQCKLFKIVDRGHADKEDGRKEDVEERTFAVGRRRYTTGDGRTEVLETVRLRAEGGNGRTKGRGMRWYIGPRKKMLSRSVLLKKTVELLRMEE